MAKTPAVFYFGRIGGINMRKNYKERSPDHKSRKERIKEITEQLEAGVRAVFESDAYKAYLNCMSKFHNYSLNNTLLIALQRPDARKCWSSAMFKACVFRLDSGFRSVPPKGSEAT